MTDWTNLTEEQFAAAAQFLRDVHPNVRAYWADPSELSQLMASGEVQVAWSWNDAIPLLRELGRPAWRDALVELGGSDEPAGDARALSDYARTLAHWLGRFEARCAEVRAMGFDEAFIRVWRFYLAACIASFSVGRTDVVQYRLAHA